MKKNLSKDDSGEGLSYTDLKISIVHWNVYTSLVKEYERAKGLQVVKGGVTIIKTQNRKCAQRKENPHKICPNHMHELRSTIFASPAQK